METNLRCRSDLVVVPTVVIDDKYRLIRNLNVNNFQVEVDRTGVPIASFWREQEPVSAVIVFDASGSMKSVLKNSTVAVDAFLQLARPDDEYALILCKDRIETAVPFTEDLSKIRAASSVSVAKGSTPLYDSLGVALQLIQRGRHPRKVILVVSDGNDTSSHLGYRMIRSRVLESQAYIYAVQFWTGQNSDDFLNRALSAFAELTGGVYLGDVPEKRFVDVFTELDIHERYMLAFQPHSEVHDDKWHKIAVRVRDIDVRKPRVFWRRGYSDKSIGEIQ